MLDLRMKDGFLHISYLKHLVFGEYLFHRSHPSPGLCQCWGRTWWGPSRRPAQGLARPRAGTTLWDLPVSTGCDGCETMTIYYDPVGEVHRCSHWSKVCWLTGCDYDPFLPCLLVPVWMSNALRQNSISNMCWDYSDWHAQNRWLGSVYYYLSCWCLPWIVIIFADSHSHSLLLSFLTAFPFY